MPVGLRSTLGPRKTSSFLDQIPLGGLLRPQAGPSCPQESPRSYFQSHFESMKAHDPPRGSPSWPQIHLGTMSNHGFSRSDPPWDPISPTIGSTWPYFGPDPLAGSGPVHDLVHFGRIWAQILCQDQIQTMIRPAFVLFRARSTATIAFDCQI